jgi:hypothetical protein
MLIDFVTDSVRHIVLEEDADVISRLTRSRTQCEKWLQIELFKRFIRRFPDNKIVPERPYPWGGSNRRGCDLWCRESDGGESWVELKTCATNYGSSGRPITQQIAAAICDIERLKTLPSDAKRYLFLLAYPIPVGGRLEEVDGTRPDAVRAVSFSRGRCSVQHWSDHLSKLQNSGATVEEVLRAPINLTLWNEPTYVVGYTILPLT